MEEIKEIEQKIDNAFQCIFGDIKFLDKSYKDYLKLILDDSLNDRKFVEMAFVIKNILGHGIYLDLPELILDNTKMIFGEINYRNVYGSRTKINLKELISSIILIKQSQKVKMINSDRIIISILLYKQQLIDSEFLKIMLPPSNKKYKNMMHQQFIQSNEYNIKHFGLEYCMKSEMDNIINTYEEFTEEEFKIYIKNTLSERNSYHRKSLIENILSSVTFVDDTTDKDKFVLIYKLLILSINEIECEMPKFIDFYSNQENSEKDYHEAIRKKVLNILSNKA